jgi:hypothetical protein
VDLAQHRCVAMRWQTHPQSDRQTRQKNVLGALCTQALLENVLGRGCRTEPQVSPSVYLSHPIYSVNGLILTVLSKNFSTLKTGCALSKRLAVLD